MESQLQVDNNELLKDIIYRNYFHSFQTGTEKHIELILSHKPCQKQCEECYLKKDSKYPFSFILDKEKTITNFKSLLQFYILNNFICDIEISGSTWLLDLDYCQSIFNILKELLIPYNKQLKIIIRSDMRFLLDKSLTDLIESYINIFSNNNITIQFLAFVNGKYCDNNFYTESFYKILFDFIKTFNGKIISYITPSNIKNWILNYKWWISAFGFIESFKYIELKELKNNNWNKSNISAFVQFLDFQIDYLSSFFPTDTFLRLIINNQDNLTFTNCYLKNQEIFSNKKQQSNCNFHKALSINVQDLTIIPCHKISYNEFSIGKLQLKNPDDFIQETNLELLILNTHLKRSSTPHCEICPYLNLCDGFCYGESFNSCYNIIIPILESCKLTYAKFNFLIYKYSILEYLNKENLEEYSNDKLYIDNILQIQRKIEKEDY